MLPDGTMGRSPLKYAHEIIAVSILVLAVACVYAQVAAFDFISLDDGTYVKYNHSIREGLTLKGVSWAFTSMYASNWHPVTWLSHMADVRLFGWQPGMHHLMNVFFHTAGTVLLFLFLRSCTGVCWKSFGVAALFALHPLHVESVAWISERKDVLSTFFWMLTLLGYAWYAKKPSLQRYLLVACSFALGLMAKPMLVTLPFVLLLLDYWPLKRLSQANVSLPLRKKGIWASGISGAGLRQLLIEKIPLFIMAGGSSIITFTAQENGGAVNSLETVPVFFRISNSLTSYTAYLLKMVWPVDLAVFYPLPHSISPISAAGAFVLLLAITALVLWAHRKFSYLAVGWFWYLGTLVPVIGLIQVGGQSMADRYTYVPLIGIFIMITWGLGDLFARWRYGQMMLGGASLLVLVLLVSLTWIQVGTWKNSISLFTHAIRITQNNYLAHHNLGCAFYEKGRMQEAVDHYTEAIRIYPDYGLAHMNLALALEKQGKYKEALSHYYKASRLNPKSALSHYYIGKGIYTLGNNLKEAHREFTKALVLNPHYVEAWNNLGMCFTLQGKIEEGKSCYMEALRINPDFYPARVNLAGLLKRQKHAHKVFPPR